MKLEYRKTWKVTEAEFFRKFLVFGNLAQKVKFGPKFVFFWKYLENTTLDFFIFLHEIRPY